MKTSAQLSRRQGFTLLEMLAVLSLMVIVLGIGAGSFMFFDQENPFEKPSQELARMAREAHHQAVLQHQRRLIAFDKTGFGVVGESGGAYFALPEDMKLFIHHFGGKGWEKAEGQIWPFGEQGVCEPLKVRFETADDAYEMTFHPLTGTPIF
jgi:prepilin-type N-terminal cleavage/methylation domain-containing protein